MAPRASPSGEKTVARKQAPEPDYADYAAIESVSAPGEGRGCAWASTGSAGPENLILYVEALGNEIGVEVYESILDMPSLTVVAEHVAAKLNTVVGRAALKQAAESTKQKRRWLPQVRVPLLNPGVV